MAACDTCTVVLKDGGKDTIVINKSDFDSELHKKVMVKKAAVAYDDDGDDGGEEKDSKASAKKGGK